MFGAFALSLAQLRDPPILRVLVGSLVLTLGVVVALAVAAGWLLDGRDPCGLVGLGTCPLGRGESGAAALIAGALAGWLLFPAVAIGIVSLFSDRIVAAVERRHYPAAAGRAREPGIGKAMAMGLASAGRVLAINLVALPVYLVLLVTGVGTVALFVVVNALALGRDLGDMVAVRHLERASRAAWRQRTRGRRFTLGVGVAILFIVPFVNLLAPVLGAAMATHLFHRRAA